MREQFHSIRDVTFKHDTRARGNDSHKHIDARNGRFKLKMATFTFHLTIECFAAPFDLLYVSLACGLRAFEHQPLWPTVPSSGGLELSHARVKCYTQKAVAFAWMNSIQA